MIGRLNHVGIATPSMDEALAFYRDVLGALRIHPKQAVPAQGVSVCFVDLPNTQVELIEPLGAGSPLTKFLAQNPKGGQHHVCFEVEEIQAAAAALQGMGMTLLGSGTPRIGAHGTPVLFLHPRGTGGVLVELMEAPRGSNHA